MFLYHYNQVGGARSDRGAPLNVLKRVHISYYSVNFRQPNSYYDFYRSDMVDVFLNAVHRIFTPQRNLTYKFQAYFEIVNQQRTPDNNFFLTENKSWITNVFRFKYFNEFLRGELKNEVTMKIINNGLTGSSWFFKRFERLNVIVVPLIKESKIITTKLIFLFRKKWLLKLSLCYQKQKNLYSKRWLKFQLKLLMNKLILKKLTIKKKKR